MLAPAPAPWTTRHASKPGSERAIAQPTEATVNNRQANKMTGLRPYLSDIGPYSKGAMAKPSINKLIVKPT